MFLMFVANNINTESEFSTLENFKVQNLDIFLYKNKKQIQLFLNIFICLMIFLFVFLLLKTNEIMYNILLNSIVIFGILLLCFAIYMLISFNFSKNLFIGFLVILVLEIILITICCLCYKDKIFQSKTKFFNSNDINTILWLTLLVLFALYLNCSYKKFMKYKNTSSVVFFISNIFIIMFFVIFLYYFDIIKQISEEIFLVSFKRTLMGKIVDKIFEFINVLKSTLIFLMKFIIGFLGLLMLFVIVTSNNLQQFFRKKRTNKITQSFIMSFEILFVLLAPFLFGILVYLILYNQSDLKNYEKQKNVNFFDEFGEFMKIWFIDNKNYIKCYFTERFEQFIQSLKETFHNNTTLFILNILGFLFYMGFIVYAIIVWNFFIKNNSVNKLPISFTFNVLDNKKNNTNECNNSEDRILII